MWLILPTLKKTGTIQGLHPKKGSGYTPPRRGERLQWAGTWREEKKKDDVVHCYGCCTGQFTKALPEIACSSGQNTALILGSPSWPQTSDVHWHPVEVCILTPLKAPVLEQTSRAAPRWGFCVRGKPLRGTHPQCWEKTCGGYVTHLWNFCTQWKFQSTQLIVVTCASLLSPERVQIKIFLTLHFGVW